MHAFKEQHKTYFFNRGSIPFKLVTFYFTYLGLKISKDPKFLLKLNFLNMMDKLEVSMRNWKLLPLSTSLCLGIIIGLRMRELSLFGSGSFLMMTSLLYFHPG